jgi:hypothetical protein
MQLTAMIDAYDRGGLPCDEGARASAGRAGSSRAGQRKQGRNLGSECSSWLGGIRCGLWKPMPATCSPPSGIRPSGRCLRREATYFSS